MCEKPNKSGKSTRQLLFHPVSLAGCLFLNHPDYENLSETRCNILSLFPFVCFHTACSNIIHSYMDLVKHSEDCSSSCVFISQERKDASAIIFPSFLPHYCSRDPAYLSHIFGSECPSKNRLWYSRRCMIEMQKRFLQGPRSFCSHLFPSHLFSCCCFNSHVLQGFCELV